MNNNTQHRLLSTLRSPKWGLFYVFMGLALIALGIFDFWSYQGAKHWPTTQGTVHTSEIEMHKQWKLTNYEPHLLYSYTVEGKGYTGDTIHFGQPKILWSKTEAQALLKDYPENKMVTVYYDPEAPGTALLELKIDKARTRGILVGLGLVLFGSFWLRYRK